MNTFLDLQVLHDNWSKHIAHKDVLSPMNELAMALSSLKHSLFEIVSSNSPLWHSLKNRNRFAASTKLDPTPCQLDSLIFYRSRHAPLTRKSFKVKHFDPYRFCIHSIMLHRLQIVQVLNRLKHLSLDICLTNLVQLYYALLCDTFRSPQACSFY